MYTVLGSATTRAFRVVWALEEMGLPYDYSPLKAGSPEARAATPSGKVPALQDGETLITDSTAIMTYLADKHGQLTHPAGTLPRAKQDAFTHLVLDEIDAVIWTATRHGFILPQDRRVPEVVGSLKWEFGRNIKHLEKAFVGPYAAGDAFTVADIITTHCLNWGYAAKFPIESETLLAYAKDMRARPAYKRTVAIAKG